MIYFSAILVGLFVLLPLYENCAGVATPEKYMGTRIRQYNSNGIFLHVESLPFSNVDQNAVYDKSPAFSKILVNNTHNHTNNKTELNRNK